MSFEVNSPHFAAVARTLLAETDDFAVQNVRAGRGGPFGAALALYDPNSGEFVRVGKISANAVLKTGDASAHAEDQALSPRNLLPLSIKLLQWKIQKREAVVLFPSSGQSCQSCDAKEEIVARKYADQGLIKKGNFVVIYGAVFEDTAKIAGFNDLPYTLDLMRSAQEPGTRVSMVKHEQVNMDSLPSNISRYFKGAGQNAVIAKGDRILSVGHDKRSIIDPVSTAEVMAIRTACRDQLKHGIPEPWSLGDKNHLDPDPVQAASLYTTTAEIGPLMRGVSQWAAINSIVTVGGTAPGTRQTQETKGLGNDTFLHVLASGYNTPESAITVYRDPTFKNKAQHAWAERLKEQGNSILYNGVGADVDLERFAVQGRQRFTGISLHA